MCIHIKYHLAIECYAASSKQRSSLRRTVSSEKSKLDASVKCYNELCAACGNDSNATVEEIMVGDFPWSTLTG